MSKYRFTIFINAKSIVLPTTDVNVAEHVKAGRYEGVFIKRYKIIKIITAIVITTVYKFIVYFNI